MNPENDFEKQLKGLLAEPNQKPLDRSLWLKIQSDFSQSKSKFNQRRLVYMAMAASLLLLVGTFFFFTSKNKNSENEILAQYGLTDYNFPTLVKQRISALPKTKVDKSQAENLNILKSQLQFLDQQYANYLEYIKNNGYQEYIGKQIQNYYEVKIELLDKIQQEIQKLKSRNNENSNDSDAIEWNI